MRRIAAFVLPAALVLPTVLLGVQGVVLLTAALSAQTPAAIAAPPDVAAPPADAVKTSSGLASKVITRGTGKTHPAQTDLVTMHYTGWTTDGKMFDSSVVQGRPSTFSLDRLITGWTEGVQLMVAGEKRRFWIPEPLAYRGQRDPKGMLVFDVELISFVGSPALLPCGPEATSASTGLGPSLTGTALDPGGFPMPNARVQLRNLGTGQLIGTATSCGGGQFVFAAVPAAMYSIEVVSSAGLIVALSAPVAVTAGVTAAGVTVVASAATAGLGIGATTAGVVDAAAGSLGGAAAPAASIAVMAAASAAQVAAVVVPVAQVLASPSQ